VNAEALALAVMGAVIFFVVIVIAISSSRESDRIHRKYEEERENAPMGPNETIAYHSHFVRLGKEVEGLDPNARCGWIERNQTFLIAGLEAHYMMADGRLSKKHAIEKAREKLKLPYNPGDIQ